VYCQRLHNSVTTRLLTFFNVESNCQLCACLLPSDIIQNCTGQVLEEIASFFWSPVIEVRLRPKSFMKSRPLLLLLLLSNTVQKRNLISYLH